MTTMAFEAARGALTVLLGFAMACLLVRPMVTVTLVTAAIASAVTGAVLGAWAVHWSLL